MAGVITRPNIARINIIVLVVVLTKQLSMTCYSLSSSEVHHRGFVGCIAVGAPCGEKPRENTADDGSQEWETRARDGDIAFCGSPVGGCDIAVYLVG